jgi:hypothetical protein
MACCVGNGHNAPRRNTNLVRHSVTSRTRHVRPETREAQPRACYECRRLTQGLLPRFARIFDFPIFFGKSRWIWARI